MGLRILVSNDDGWDHTNLRCLYNKLVEEGHDVVLSAALEGRSGKGRLTEPPNPEEGDPTGNDGPDGRLNWVRSYPLTGAQYGLDTFGPKVWKGEPCDLVISGPNTNWNIGKNLKDSGTSNIARYAAAERKIPAIAVSASSRQASTVAAGSYLARLTYVLIDELIKSGPPYLPEGVWLNVNLPFVSSQKTGFGVFKWVFSQIRPKAYAYCGSELEKINPTRESDRSFDNFDIDNLPSEGRVLTEGFNRISISINTGEFKNASKEDIQLVKGKLSGLVACNKLEQGKSDTESTTEEIFGQAEEDPSNHVAGNVMERYDPTLYDPAVQVVTVELDYEE